MNHSVQPQNGDDEDDMDDVIEDDIPDDLEVGALVIGYSMTTNDSHLKDKKGTKCQ